MAKGKKLLMRIFFLNDDDGFSSRDFLLISTISMYSLLFVYCMFSLVMYKSIPEDAFNLFGSTDAVLITVVGGTMSVVGIEKFVGSKQDNKITHDEVVYVEEKHNKPHDRNDGI